MAALLQASIQNGTSRGSRTGAWIVSVAGQSDPGGVLAEGPVLDLLLRGHPSGLAMRPASPLERLLGRAAGGDGDQP